MAILIDRRMNPLSWSLLWILVSACAKGPVPPHKIFHLNPAWHAEGEDQNGSFGTRAMAAGDVNGDGYDDLIIGAPRWGGNTGKAYLYLGSAQGLGKIPAWTITGDAHNDMLGDRVGQAGDVNGDGFDDFFVTAPGWKGGLGHCLVFYGGPHGLNHQADWSAQASTQGSQFGDCTHPTGDLNGDGYDDLAVGSYGFDETRGQILVFNGSAHGLSKTPSWHGEGDAKHDWYGYGIGAAGDVNGDGFDDLLAGAKYNAQGGHDAGKAYLYLGSSLGPSRKADWTWEGPHPDANATVRIATAGDVNGDGYSDVLVSAPGTDGSLGDLYIFFGGPKGLKNAPDQVLHRPDPELQFFGQGACPAGDLDGDGYDDLAVHGRDKLGRGKVFIYRGSAHGLEEWPTWEIDGEGQGDRFGWWVAPAGDLDGDGLADLVISAESQGRGKVYVVYGKQFKAISENVSQTPVIHAMRRHGYLRKKSLKAGKK